MGIIVPVVADQFESSDLVNRRGVGVGFQSLTKMSSLELALAIERCESQEIREHASKFGSELQSEVDSAPALLKQELERYYREDVVTGKHVNRMKQRLGRYARKPF